MDDRVSKKIKVKEMLLKLSDGEMKSCEEVLKNLEEIEIDDTDDKDFVDYYKKVLKDVNILLLIHKLYSMSVPLSEIYSIDNSEIINDYEQDIVNGLKGLLSDKEGYDNIISTMMKYKQRKKYFDDDILNSFDDNKAIEALKKAIEKVLKINVVDLSIDPQLMGALGAAEYARQKGLAK